MSPAFSVYGSFLKFKYATHSGVRSGWSNTQAVSVAYEKYILAFFQILNVYRLSLNHPWPSSCVWISHRPNCFTNLDIPRIDRNVCIHSALTNHSFMLHRLNYLILHGHSTISQPIDYALSVYTDQSVGIHSRPASSELMKKLCTLSIA